MHNLQHDIESNGVVKLYISFPHTEENIIHYLKGILTSCKKFKDNMNLQEEIICITKRTRASVEQTSNSIIEIILFK